MGIEDKDKVYDVPEGFDLNIPDKDKDKDKDTDKDTDTDTDTDKDKDKDKDNIFIIESSGTALLLALWSLLGAIGCSLVAEDTLTHDLRLSGYLESLQFHSILGYLSLILCTFWSGAVGR